MGVPFPYTTADPAVDWLAPAALLPHQEVGQIGPTEGRDWLVLETSVAQLLSRGVCCFLITWLPPSVGCMRGLRTTAVLLGGGAAVLLSLLWMPALLPVASRLQLLPRALLSMASGSSPSQSSPASGSSYIPGSVSAAFVTCPNETVAKEIARAVVEKRLAACVNVIPQITSIYEWKGKIEEDSEVLMMIKTQSSLVPALTDFVRSVHPYEVAEVIALPVEQGNFPYLHWVHQVTKSVSD